MNVLHLKNMKKYTFKYFILKDPRFHQNYSVRNFFRIPQTNIVLINTVDHSSESASIVFYNDISNPQGEIIQEQIHFIQCNIIADYVIQSMDYISSREKILIVNYQNIIIADPFTLNIVDKIVLANIQLGYMIKDSNLAIMMMDSNDLNIFDTTSVELIFTLTHSSDTLNGQNTVMLTMKSYYFKCQEPLVLLISTVKNILVWSFDHKNLSSDYHGLLDYSQHTMNNNYRRVVKHLTEDVIFMTGENYQIIALKVISFKGKQYQKLMEINLYDKQNADIITNIQLVYVLKDQIQVPTLIVSETQNLIKVELVINSQNKQINSIEALNTVKPFSISAYNNQTWSLLEESNQIMFTSDRALVFYDYQTENLRKNLYIEGDNQSRRFFYYKNDQMIIATPIKYDIILEEKPNFGLTYKMYSSKFNFPIRGSQISYPVKNCQGCILILLGLKDDLSSYIITSISDENFIDIIFQNNINSNFIQNIQNQKSNILVLKFNWSLTNTIIDSYKRNDNYWAAIAFPYKDEMKFDVKALFYIINAKDPSIYHALKTDDDTSNSISTRFIVASLENQDSQELIGIDEEGKIYIFDIDTFQLKKSIDFDICKKASNGEIFYNNSGKKLIVACGSNIVYSFDLQTKTFQNLKQLSDEPEVLKTYQNPPILIMSDFASGQAYFFKYDKNTDKFNQFFQISPGKYNDKITMIDLLKDNSLWIQYRTSHLFYNFSKCIEDPDLCSQCTQSYYFDITNEYKNRLYGQGSQASPFTGSRNLIIAMINKHNQHQKQFKILQINQTFMKIVKVVEIFIRLQHFIFYKSNKEVSILGQKFGRVSLINENLLHFFKNKEHKLIFYKQNQAQQYKDAIIGSSNININIHVSPNNILELNKNIIDFSFTSIISLNLTSSDYNKVATIQYQDKIILSNYYKVTLQNIKFDYIINEGQSCGLQFMDIKEKVEINNIQQYSHKDSKNEICQKIIINNSILDIQKYEIIDQDFGNNKYIISTLNSNKVNYFNPAISLIFTFNFQINISNLSLIGCTIREDFSILQQQTDIQAFINNLQLINNKCAQISDNKLPPSSLFTAGYFSVKTVKIAQNIFCNQNIFSTIPLLSHLDQQFEFHDVEVFNNQFYIKTNYILFNAFYSMIQNPAHSLLMNNIQFKNNKLNQKLNSKDDLIISTFIQTEKIAKINLNKILLENHSDIQFCLLKLASSVDFNDFQCINDQNYFDNFTYKDKQTSSCIEIKDVSLVTINSIKIDKKKTYDNPLFVLENLQLDQSTVNINNGEFTNLELNQIKTNSYVSPIFVRSRYSIYMNMKECGFNNNILLSDYSSQTFSTTGIWVENYKGTVDIQDSSFKNCFSNSTYNFIYIQSEILQFNKVNFANSSFSITDLEKNLNQYTFIQQGGMMNIKVKKLIIKDSQLSQSTASQGSFVYSQSFSDNLEISIQNTSFSEGYSDNGGAFFIDTSSHQVNFNCDSCRFSNIYTLMTKGSAINIDQQSKYDVNKKNKFTFINGSIKNIHGNSDNYFIKVQNSEIIFKDVSEILSENFKSTSQPHQSYLNVLNQQSSFISITDSDLQINNCQFKNLKLNDNKSELSLLVNSQNSNITFNQSTIQNCIFQQNVLKGEYSNITLQSTNFDNVSQTQQIRYLSATNNELLNDQASSLIIAKNSILKVIQNSFQDIQCTSNCNGGVFQIKNGQIELSNSKIDQTQGSYGGALFIYGLQGTNFIKDMIFSNSISKYDGGSVFLSAQQENDFNLLIKNIKFQNNKSKQGYGGALFIISDILNPTNQKIDIISSTFNQNSAVLGAAIYSKNISAIDSDSKFDQNIAEKFGNNKLSYPIKVILLNYQLQNYHEVKVDQNMIEIQNFRSGDSIKNIQFHLKNKENEIVRRAKDYDLNLNVRVSSNIQNSIKYNIRGNLAASYDIKEGIFSFSNLIIVGTPGSETKIEIYSDQILILDEKINQYTKPAFSYLLKIGFRQCIMGEQKKEYNDLTECEECAKGQYSYQENKQCQDCPDGAICSGGVDVKTKAGYWRNSNQSDIILSCHNSKENCLGGLQGDEICYEGHIGALCEECDINGDHWNYSYAKSGKYSCERCDRIKNNTWFVLLITLWALFSMTLTIKSSIERIKLIAAAATLQKTLKKNAYKRVVRSKSSIQIDQNQLEIKTHQEPDNTQGIYIKLFTNYMQIVGSISTFNLSIPTGIFDFPQAVGEPLKQTTNSLDCALQQINTDIPIIYLRVIFSFLIPVTYSLIFLIGLAVYQLINKSSQVRMYTLSTTVIFLIIYVQPDFVAQVIALLSCRKIGDTNYILSNVSFKCHTEEHFYYSLFLVVPLLLLWVFILPGILFYILLKNKRQLGSTEIQLKYGILYKEYKNRAFYWEFVKMFEKILIILSLNFYSQFIITKGILVYVIIFIYGILSIYIQPYEDKEINDIDSRSTYVCAVTVLLGLFIYIIISIMLMVIVNVWFIYKILQKILFGYFEKIKEILLPILKKLEAKIPILAKIFKLNNTKKMNPIIKEKMKKLFSIYLEMTIIQKEKFIMKVVKQLLVKKNKHIFRRPINSEIDGQSTNILIDNHSNLNSKQKDINLLHVESESNYPQNQNEKAKVNLQKSEDKSEKNSMDTKFILNQKNKNYNNQLYKGEEEIDIVTAKTEQDDINDIQTYQSPHPNIFIFDERHTKGESQQNEDNLNGFKLDKEDNVIKNEDILFKFDEDTQMDIPQNIADTQNRLTMVFQSNAQILADYEYSSNNINSNQNIQRI